MPPPSPISYPPAFGSARQIPFARRGLLGAARDDVVGGLLDRPLPLGQPLQGIEQFRLSGLLSPLVEELGKSLGAGVDPHLERANHLELGEFVD